MTRDNIAINAITNKKYSWGFNFIERGCSLSLRWRNGGYCERWSELTICPLLSCLRPYVARSALSRNLDVRKIKIQDSQKPCIQYDTTSN